MILIYGLGLLGYTTAACLATWGRNVAMVIDETLPEPPAEPGLVARLQEGKNSGNLSTKYIQDYRPTKTDIAWITYDTPVDSLGNPDNARIQAACSAVCKSQADGAVVIVSSQVRVGFTRSLQAEFPGLRIVCAPENIRRGHALRDFETSIPIIGLPDTVPVHLIETLYQHGGTPKTIYYSTLETAEMVKHARNAFLAMSISFANEIAEVCKSTGASYADVQDALHADPRIGPQAYLGDGKADGRHMLRDVRNLLDINPDLWVIREILRSPAWLP